MATDLRINVDNLVAELRAECAKLEARIRDAAAAIPALPPDFLEAAKQAAMFVTGRLDVRYSCLLGVTAHNAVMHHPDGPIEGMLPAGYYYVVLIALPDLKAKAEADELEAWREAATPVDGQQWEEDLV